MVHGGILIYTKSSLLVLPIPILSDIEFLLLSIKKGHHTFSVGTFYRPPSSPHDLDILHDTLYVLNPSYLLNLVLVGDFNVNFSNSISPLFHKVSVLSDSFSLLQIIQKATHYSNSGSPSTIDLVFIPTSFQLCPYSILPPVSSSDHNTILFSLNFLLSQFLFILLLFPIVCGCMIKLIIS